MEVLSSMFTKAVEDGIIKGFRTPNGGPVISHLLYANDEMVVGEWSKKFVLFDCNVAGEEVREMAGVIGCKIGKMSFLHLVIMVGANMNIIKNWNGIIEVFEKRLAMWKAHSLSIGGRVVMIKSVLENLTKINWVAWERVALPKEDGGKMVFEVQDGRRKRLEKTVLAINAHCSGWGTMPFKSGNTRVWINIAKAVNKMKFDGSNFGELKKGYLGDGSKLSFWYEFGLRI
ncbi:uncharacterized protein LOC143623336 [Bidens hawaiensis]|uniref:uncharacterized protein LOC143623336 n=1 Tax=Bidens hawaiensis TaxID=980011 RepID=UPI00404B2EE5